MIIVNGEKKQCPQNMNFKNFLQSQGYDLKLVAVECNGEIVPKTRFEEKRVEDGDSIEVVSFVGGG